MTEILVRDSAPEGEKKNHYSYHVEDFKAEGRVQRFLEAFAANLRHTLIDRTTLMDGKWCLVRELVNQSGAGRDLR